MAYTYLELRNFQGLYLQQNSFEVPDGAMEKASRVVIRSDQVITKTNGLYEFWRPDVISTLDGLNATYTYQGKIIGFFSNGVGRFEETFPYGGTFNAVGELTENDSENVLAFSSSTTMITAGGNLYFTADKGIHKLEAFDAKVLRAGIPPGLGVDIDFKAPGYSISGILEPDTQTGYRGVFGRRDLNGNLHLGTPTDIITVGVPPLIIGANYTISGGLITIDISENYFLQNYGSPIGGANFDAELSNATDPLVNGLAVGVSLVPGTSATFTTGAPNGSGTVDVAFYYSPTFIVQIPSEIKSVDDEYFVQFYKTSSSLSLDAGPNPNFRLFTEITLTQDDLDAGEVRVLDNVDPNLLGAELYTNPNTREGPLQENSRPPKAKIISTYKGHGVYANIQSVQRASLSLANPLLLTSLVFKSGPTQEVYKAVDSTVYLPGNVNPFVGNITALSPLTIDLGFTHSFPLGSKVQINGSEYGGVTPGEYTVTAVGASSVTLNTTSTLFGDIYGQFVADTNSRLFNGYMASDWTFSNLAEWTEFVTRDLVRAINGNPNSFMYANYRSTFSDFPGLFSFESKDFIEPIFVRTGDTPSSPVFLQNVPDSFTDGIQFYSTNDIQKHWLYMSKFGEQEAVPVTNVIPVGSASGAITEVYPLKDSLIVLKEDGAFKVIGDIVSQMVAVPIDTTVKFMTQMARGAGTINNSVIAFSNQGIVQISENSLQIISRRIEDVIQPLVGRDLSSTYLFGHESDRLFYVQTSGINPGDAPVTWLYNVLNQTWTSTPDVFSHLITGPGDALVGIRFDDDIGKNTLWRQRRTNTRVDYCGEYVIGNIVVDLVDKKVGVFTITGGNIAVPEVGDVILAQNIFNRILKVEEDSGDYILTFAQDTSMVQGVPTEVTLYKAYESIVKMAPFHAGQVGRSKHFAQLQIHLRQQVITDVEIEFAGSYFGSSEVTDWQAMSLSTAGAQGWGFSPWGLFPWGLVDGANLVAGTEPASIIRTYVPRFAARNTFIQAILSHNQAGQPMLIQALSYAVHGYKERVTR